MARSKKQRQYTEDDKAAALAALDSNGGNVAKTARDLEIPEPTLRKWKNGKGINRAVAPKYDAKKESLASLWEQVVRVYIAHAIQEDTVAAEKGKDAVIAAATGQDKLRLVRGQPTDIHQHDHSNLTDDQLEQRIRELESRTRGALPPPAGTGTPPTGNGTPSQPQPA